MPALRRLLTVLTTALAGPLAAHADPSATPCQPAAPCTVLQSSYVAVPPLGWDGVTPLKPAVWLHGYEQDANQVMAQTELVQVFKRAGVLLLVPTGREGYWAVPGVPNRSNAPGRRDDVAFVTGVLDDAARRFPLDRSKATVLGFSLGASMVYTLACANPATFSRFVAIAGSFWNPLPATCAPGDLDLLHIHGTDDPVMPLEGRPIGPTARQGNVLAGLAFWRQAKRCAAAVPTPSASPAFRCETAACAGTSRITYCSHGGGHDADPAWVAWALTR